MKVPKLISHERALAGADQELDRFLGECTALGDKLGPLLVQLPPKSALDTIAASHFGAKSQVPRAPITWPRERVESPFDLSCDHLAA